MKADKQLHSKRQHMSPFLKAAHCSKVCILASAEVMLCFKTLHKLHENCGPASTVTVEQLWNFKNLPAMDFAFHGKHIAKKH